MEAPAHSAILWPSPVLQGAPCMLCTPFIMGQKASSISSSSEVSPVHRMTPLGAFTFT